MVADATTSLLDRYFANLRKVWRDVSAYLPGATHELDADLTGTSTQELRARLQECLDARGGEVSARARAAVLGHTYLRLSPKGRRLFLSTLAHDFDVNRGSLAELALAYREADAPGDQEKLEHRLREALTAPRVKLLTQFNALPQGVKFLVDMRADLLQALAEDPSLASLDSDMRLLLSSWFDVGFLDMAPITWDSPASLLEKLIAYEAVHKIQSWHDLRNRLDSDRRCYAFFHPRMPSEPLIFVQVALVSGVSSNIQDLLDEGAPASDPKAADTAIFYSISNAQVGLRGIGFGNFLIKKVVDSLSRELPQLKTFATLSPIPGFRRWLARLDSEALAPILPARRSEPLLQLMKARGIEGDFRELLDQEGWHADGELAEALREPLLGVCAHYLLKAGKPSSPADPVARFHLGNGASIDRLNWLGDRSPKGMAEAAGLMVNYRYRLDEIEENHEALATHGTIAASDAVRAHLAKGRDLEKRDGGKFSFFGTHARNG